MSLRSEAASPAGRYRFYVPEPPQGREMTLTGEPAHRIARVLRLSEGTELLLFDGSGRSWAGEIGAAGGGAVRVMLHGGAREHPALSRTSLLAALIRPNRFEWLLEKATELGVTSVQPVLCERNAVRPAEIGAARLERWRRIMIEAAEQCGRVTIPDLATPLPLAAALEASDAPLFVATEPAHGTAPSLGAVLAGVGGGPVAVLTGPEGGLTAAEVEVSRIAGGGLASLGPLVLRAETAAIAALAIVADARVTSSEWRVASGE